MMNYEEKLAKACNLMYLEAVRATKLFPPFNTTFHPGHVANSFIFGLLVAVHIWLNRKSIARYFTGLRWWWILVGLGLAVVIWVGVGLPITLT